MLRSKDDHRISARPPVPKRSERITSANGMGARTPESRGPRSVNSTLGRISKVESSDVVVCIIHATTGRHGSDPCRQAYVNTGRLADRGSHKHDRRSPKNRALTDTQRIRIKSGDELKMARREHLRDASKETHDACPARRDRGWMCAQKISCKAGGRLVCDKGGHYINRWQAAEKIANPT